jgi:hypothetical protein
MPNYPAYEEIRHEGELIAIILRREFSSDKTLFFGKPEYSQQLGYIVYPKGGKVKSHFHREVPRNIVWTQEVLFIKRGRVEVNFYTIEKEPITTRELSTNDVIFLCSGGHGIKMLEDTEMVEVKQGPYLGKESDKIVFED